MATRSSTTRTRAWWRRDDFARPGEPKAQYERKQYGMSFGGPIIKDKLHFFVAYEGNDQDRAERVTLGNPAAEPVFGQYQGAFVQPFREDLFFAKLDFQPTYNQTMDLSFSLRDESDIKDFSGQNSYEAANDIQNEVRTVKFGHTYDAESFTNEATLLYMKYEWHPTPVNYDLIGREYVGIIRIGGGVDQAEHRPGSADVQGRPDLHRIRLAGRTLGEDRPAHQQGRLRRAEVPGVQSALPLPPGDRRLRVPSRSGVRRRQSRSLGRRPRSTVFTFRTIGRSHRADAESRRALGLRHRSARQRLRHAGGDSRRRVAVSCPIATSPMATTATARPT